VRVSVEAGKTARADAALGTEGFEP
jgi:hypothetical protein